VEVAQVVARPEGGHALSVDARLAVKASPLAGASFPCRGALYSLSTCAPFLGLRSRCAARVAIILDLTASAVAGPSPSPQARDGGAIKLPFSALSGRSPWTGDDVTSLSLTTSRKGGEKVWLEIDKLTFY